MIRLLVVIWVGMGCAANPGESPGPGVSTGSAQAPQSPVVASWQGDSLTYADLTDRIKNQLIKLESEYLISKYQLESQTLDAMVNEALLTREASHRNLAGVDALLTLEVENKVPEPTDSQVQALYEQVKGNLQGAPLQEARPLIAAELTRRGQKERYMAYIAQLREQAEVTTQLAYPELPRIQVPVFDHDPVLGPVDAPVTIVEFAEYQCYFCKKVNPTLKQLLDHYQGKVRLVYKDFPLPSHPQAKGAAVAGHCAGEQDAYWPMGDKMLANQQALLQQDLLGYADALGLKSKPFAECLASGRYEPLIDQDVQLGQQLGVEATPTFFVNGVLVAGAQPYEQFAALIDRELGRVPKAANQTEP